MGRHSPTDECEVASWNHHWIYQTNRDSTCSLTIAGNEDPSNCFMDSIGKPSCVSSGMPCLQSPPPGPQSHSTFCTSNLPYPPPCGQLPVCVLEGRECELRWMASENAQKVGPKLWDSEKAHKLQYSTPPKEKQMGGCQHLVWLFRLREGRQTILRTPPQEGIRSLEQVC